MVLHLNIVILGVAFASALYATCRYYYARFKMRKLIGPPPLPIIGNLHQLGGDNPAFLRTLMKWADEYRDSGYFVIYFGWTPNVMIFNPRDMETVLSDTRLDSKSFHNEFFRSWLHDGLGLSKGQKWVTRRKLLTPSFHFSILKTFNAVFNDQARIFTDRLCDWADGGEINLATPTSLCTLDVVFETIMGTNPRSQSGYQNSYVHAIESLGNIFMKRVKYPWYWNEAVFQWTSLGRRWAEYAGLSHRKCRQVIEDREKYLEENRGGDITIDDPDQPVRNRRRLALLDLLIEAQRQGRGISDEGIQEEVAFFMFAGHDTVASAISFAFYLLARHPEVQKKVHQELDRVFDDDRERPVTMDDIQQLQYLSCVIKESQRLLTTAPNIMRTLDVDIKACGTTLSKGTTVMLGLFLLHRNPEQFPDPLRFDPDRFLPENSGDRHTFSFLPFSAGHRNCIGQKFAILEQKTIMATVLRKLTMTSSQTIEELNIAIEMVLRASNGIMVKLHHRE